jgi:hypothetical protein
VTYLDELERTHELDWNAFTAMIFLNPALQCTAAGSCSDESFRRMVDALTV